MNKEEFLDEKILELINQVEKPAPTAPAAEDSSAAPRPAKPKIYSGIKDGGQLIEFAERHLVEDKIAVMIPIDFKEMDQESAKIKYPMEQRPGTILTDYTGTINILFSYMDEHITNADVEPIRDKMLTTMRRVNPGVKPHDTGLEIISGQNVAYVEFTHNAIDSKMYNLMYFMELDGKTLMGIINCPTRRIKYWQEPAREMMRSIRLLNREETLS